MTAPDGSVRTFDNNPAVVVPHEYDVGYDGMLMEEEPISYPQGFDDTVVRNCLVYVMLLTLGHVIKRN
jgi:hypothetical protein